MENLPVKRVKKICCKCKKLYITYFNLKLCAKCTYHKSAKGTISRGSEVREVFKGKLIGGKTL